MAGEDQQGNSERDQTAAILLLLLLGVGFWLYAVLPPIFGADDDDQSPVFVYFWRDQPQAAAGVYRVSIAAAGPHLAPVRAVKPDPSSEHSSPFHFTVADPAHLTLFSFAPLPLNRADSQTLTLLPGIGPTLGQRIVDHRTQHGPFQNRDDLLLVHGIGPKTLGQIRDLVATN